MIIIMYLLQKSIENLFISNPTKNSAPDQLHCVKLFPLGTLPQHFIFSIFLFLWFLTNVLCQIYFTCCVYEGFTLFGVEHNMTDNQI